MRGWFAVASAAGILAACSLAPFDEFSGGDAIPDASSAGDAPGDDARTPSDDASPGVDAGDAGPASRGCADYPGVFFCSDFDDGRLPGPWVNQFSEAPAAATITDDLAFSPGKSLRVHAPSGSSGMAASVSRTYTTVPTTKAAHYQLVFRYEEHGTADLEILAFRFGEYYVQVQIGSDEYPYLIDRRPGIDGGAQSSVEKKGSIPVDPKRWYKLRLDVDLVAKTTALFMDGASVASRTLPPEFVFDTEGLRIVAGDLFIPDNVGTWDVRIDDVVVSVE